MVDYGVAFSVFILGLVTSIATAAFIIINYFKFKDRDPFEGEL